MIKFCPIEKGNIKFYKMIHIVINLRRLISIREHLLFGNSIK